MNEKLKQLAENNDFEGFYSELGIKDRVSAKILFNRLKPINEGIYDPAIFKAVFLAGGSGSGKDFILKKVVAGNNLKELNADHAFEMLMKKNQLSMLMPDSETKQRNLIRGMAVKTNIDQERLAFGGRLGVVVNGTGADPNKIYHMKQVLESLGYSTMMIFVNTSNEVSKARNIARGQRGGRTVPEDLRSVKWHEAQHNIEFYRRLFGYNFIEIDNSTDAKDMTQSHHANLEAKFKQIRHFVSQPLNDIAKAWIIRQKQKRHITEKVYEVGTAAAVDNSAKHVPGQGQLVSIEVLRKKYHSPFNPDKFIAKDTKKKNV